MLPQSIVPVLRAALLLTIAHGAVARVQAQDDPRRPELALLGGPVSYDFSGVGTSWGLGARASIPLARAFAVEPGVSFFSYETQFGEGNAFLFPEVSALVHTGQSLQAFLAAGVGASIVAQGEGSADVAGHVGAGLRTALGGPWGFRAEARYRIDTSNSTLVEVFLGVTRRL